MSNLFAWASIDERGRATGGKAGDQTGREVLVGPYYHFGQDMVIRFKNKKYGRKAGKIAKKLAKCESIGYNQTERHQLPNLASKCNWNYKQLLKALKKTKVNCDCSSFASTVINLAYGKKVVPISTTATIWNNCKPTGKFEKVSVSKAEKKFHKGDMPVKANNHIIINV